MTSNFNKRLWKKECQKKLEVKKSKPKTERGEHRPRSLQGFNNLGQGKYSG